MCERRRRGMLRGMDQPAHVIRLELFVDGDSLTGSAFACGVKERRFAGWLGLVATVEALITATPERDPGAENEPATEKDARGEAVT